MPSSQRSELRTRGGMQIWRGYIRKDAIARNPIALKTIASVLKPRLRVQTDANAALVGIQRQIDRSGFRTGSQLLLI